MESDLKYEILRDSKLGRYLVAKSFLKKGTLIFTDVPFVTGPKQDSLPLCLGCHKFWNRSYYCSNCGWPCCSELCENNPTHKEYECKVFGESNAKFQNVKIVTQPCIQFDCITPLRMLLSKEKNPIRWDKEVSVMEDHETERKLRPNWEVDNVNITEYLRGPCKLENRFSESLIQKICGILEVNSVEIPSSCGPNIRGIYPNLAIMSHNCVPTVSHTILSGGKNDIPQNIAQIWAADDINSGEKLELCYTHVLSCTVQRRYHLKQSKFFDCDCRRCSDPSELKTNLSSIRCNVCDNGTILPVDPLDYNSLWNCCDCKYSTTGNNVFNVVNVIQTEIDKLEQISYGPDEIDVRENELKWYQNILHPTHSLLVNLKYSLLQAYGHANGYELSIPDLKRKIDMCNEVLQILGVISPGENRMRGILLYELHESLLKFNKIQLKAGNITPEQNSSDMLEILNILEECGRILMKEDENSSKGVLGRKAMQKYNELKLYITS